MAELIRFELVLKKVKDQGYYDLTKHSSLMSSRLKR